MRKHSQIWLQSDWPLGAHRLQVTMHKAQAVQVRYREHNLGSVQPRQRFIEDALQRRPAPLYSVSKMYGPCSWQTPRVIYGV